MIKIIYILINIIEIFFILYKSSFIFNIKNKKFKNKENG